MTSENRSKLNKKIAFFSHFGISEERDFFLENLCSLLSSGMPILNAITAVNSEIRSSFLKKIIKKLLNDIEAGQSLSKALENTGLFSDHVASLIRIGEQSGRLIENLKIIAVEEKKERSLKSKLHSAAIYPIFVFSLTLIIGAGVSWFLLPKLTSVFSDLNIKLPLITKLLVGFGDFLTKYGMYAIPAFIIFICVLFYFVFIFSKFKIIGENILFSFPGVKKLLKEAEIARFGYLFGSLISAGLSPNSAIDSISRATSLVRYRKFYEFIKNEINEGNSFQKIFYKYKKIGVLFPITVQQLIITGEQSGTLSSTLIKIGEDYEARTEISVKDLTTILEPVLLIVVGVGVITVALAIILPIYGLIGGLQSNP